MAVVKKCKVVLVPTEAKEGAIIGRLKKNFTEPILTEGGMIDVTYNKGELLHIISGKVLHKMLEPCYLAIKHPSGLLLAVNDSTQHLPVPSEAFVNRFILCNGVGMEEVGVVFEDDGETPLIKHGKVILNKLQITGDKSIGEVKSILFTLAEHYGKVSTSADREDFNKWVETYL